MSFKKGKKLLARADPEQRSRWIRHVRPLMKRAWRSDKRLLVFIDEAHIHCDCDLGFGWSKRGGRLWVHSRSPGLSQRVSFFGVYVWSESDVHLEPYSRADGDSTILTLMRLRDRYPKHAIDVVWDGAAYHRSVGVQCAAKKLSIRLHRLPGYSPDFMPVEALWRWLRSEVTANYCHRDTAELIGRVANFEHTARKDPERLRERLGLPMKLDPAVEKLRCPSR